MNPDRDQVVALAGVFQAARLAQQLARRGYEEKDPFESSIRSLFIQDAINTVSVFGGVTGVRFGLETMRDKLATGRNPADLEIARYVLGLSQLGIKLARDGQMARVIASEIDKLKPEIQHRNDDGIDEGVYAELARIYRDTVSNLKPKIIVQGEHGYLSNALVVDKVRSILFSGVRASFLWNQLGGRRWHLVLKRKPILSIVEDLIAESSGQLH